MSVHHNFHSEIIKLIARLAFTCGYIDTYDPTESGQENVLSSENENSFTVFFQSQILKRDQERNEFLRGLKEFLRQIFVWGGGWGGYYISCQKRLCKIKYGFKGSISNIDPGLF